MKRKAFFFDRDGIVNKRLMGGYVTRPSEFEFQPDFVALFQLVKSHGFYTVIITNQQGIGKGIMTENDLSDVHNYMQLKLIESTGISFDAIYYCGDLEQTNSQRRKPNPGMLLEAIEAHYLDSTISIMLGDSISDVQAGKAVGSTTILIGDFSKVDVPEADYIFDSLGSCSKFLETYLQ
ncbi:MAG: HAD-IIIA family hydrolase [Ignavibacteria bacterium]|nr:HAD-IIIA family hydrolase [Ignavibacteria bacterium]